MQVDPVGFSGDIDIDAGGGFEAIWFVQDKELVGVTYRSVVPGPAELASRHQKVLQIARAVQAKIVASGESGGHDNRGHGNDPERVAAAMARAHQLNQQMESEEIERRVVSDLTTAVPGTPARQLDSAKTERYFSQN